MAQVTFKSQLAERTTLCIAMVNACHRNTVEGAGLGTFAATFTNILIEDNTVFTHGNSVKRTSFHAFGLRALTALYGLCHVLGNLNLDTRRKVVAVRVHVEYILSRVIDNAGNHTGAAADAQHRVRFDEFIHSMPPPFLRERPLSGEFLCIVQ